jgi:hypothetical protein
VLLGYGLREDPQIIELLSEGISTGVPIGSSG